MADWLVTEAFVRVLLHDLLGAERFATSGVPLWQFRRAMLMRCAEVLMLSNTNRIRYRKPR